MFEAHKRSEVTGQLFSTGFVRVGWRGVGGGNGGCSGQLNRKDRPKRSGFPRFYGPGEIFGRGDTDEICISDKMPRPGAWFLERTFLMFPPMWGDGR